MYGLSIAKKLMTLNDLERQFTALSSELRALTKRLMLSRGFRYKVALYLSYLHKSLTTKLNGIPLHFKHTFRFDRI